MQYLEIGIRCIIGTVFLVSSASKIIRHGAFSDFVVSLRNIQLVPPAFARPTAWVIVGAEFTTCVLLAIPASFAGVAGFSVAAGLLTVFAVAIALVVRSGTQAPCRCFGVSTTPMGYRHIVRNAALIAVAAAGVIGTSASEEPTHPGGIAIAVLGGLVLGGLVAVLDDIFELFQPMSKGVGHRPHSPMASQR